MRRGEGDGAGDAAAELARSLELIDAGEHAHAAHHLALVAASAPLEPRLSQAVARLCDEVDDPVALVPLSGEVDLGSVVLRGLIEARCGRLSDALCHLLQAECHDPERAYLGALSMEGAGEAALRSVDADAIGELLAGLAAASDRQSEPAAGPTLERGWMLCALLLAHHPQCEPLVFAGCLLLRRLGDYAAAVDLAQEHLEHRPGYRVLTALANALRASGDHEAAASAYRRAHAIDPQDVAAALDLGDLYGGDGRFAEALDAYALALEREPSQPWALASSHYYRYLLEDGSDALHALERLAAEGEPRARALFEQATCFEHALPPRPEALLGCLGQGVEPVTIGVSSLEAPSAVAVVRLTAPGVSIEMGEPRGNVDPRKPRSDVQLCLWRYRTLGVWPLRRPSNEADAVLDGADPAVTARIRGLAATPYAATRWYAQAAEVAAEVGPRAQRACAAAMVSFAPGPAPHRLQDWVFRCQVAAAFVIAHLPDAEPALWDLVYGPVDWVGTAALTALAQRAIAEPARRTIIAQQLLDQIHAVDSPIGYMCLSLPAAQNLLRVPGIPAEARALARAARDLV